MFCPSATDPLPVRRRRRADTDTGALIVGGGPAGCSAAIAIARAGHRVTVVERGPVDSGSWGAVLDDRAAAFLGEIGIAVPGRRVTLRPWIDAGTVVLRPDLDERLRRRCRDDGIDIVDAEALTPITDRGLVLGARCRDRNGTTIDIGAEVLVVADGANSTFGRSLGTQRRRDLPYLLGVRQRWATHRAASAMVTRSLQRDDGGDLPGLGWALPDDEGGLTVGITIPSTARDAEGVNPYQVLERLISRWRDGGRIDLGEPLGDARGGRVPVGGSVGPIAGPTFLVVGDAAAMAHPVSGLGITPALRTGTLAGRVVATALAEGDDTALQSYAYSVRSEFAEDQRRARNTVRIIGSPVGRHLVRWSPRLVRIAATASPGG